MNDLSDLKAATRSAARARRKVAHATAGPDTNALLMSVLAGYRGIPLAGYMPMQSEIDPLPSLTAAAAFGQVGVPVVQAKDKPLRFSLWEPGAVLIEGPFGAQIPAKVAFFEPEILIVPLVAFTRDGGRLGYGGGFYDRTLEALRARRPTLAIGFAYSAQEAEALPLEKTDQPLDMIVTETEIIDIPV